MERIASTETAKRIADLAKRGPVTRAEAMEALNITAAQWQLGSRAAIEAGLVEREGDKRTSVLVKPKRKN